MTPEIDQDRSGVGYVLPRVVTIVGGAGFAGLGVWGMVSRSPCFALTITP
jgi:hypothetical protein